MDFNLFFILNTSVFVLQKQDCKLFDYLWQKQFDNERRY